MVRLGAFCTYIVVIFYLGKSYHSGNKVYHDKSTRSVKNLTLDISIDVSASVDTILNSTAVLTNADKIVQIGRLLERDKFDKERVIPKNITLEYDPDKGDIFLPGGIYQDLDFKFPWQKRKMPRSVNLTDEIEEMLQKAIGLFSIEQQQKQKKNKLKERPVDMFYKNKDKR